MSRVWDESLNPYDVLELENGPQSSEADIKKAYRRLAKQKHPDKNPDAKLEEFHLIQSAYEILCDAAARAAYDAVIQARQLREEKWQRQSEKRRRMRDDLEAKERASTAEKKTEAYAQAALHAELQRLRQRLEAEHKTKTRAPRSSDHSDVADLSKVIKIKWRDDRSSWDEDRLRGVLGKFTAVQGVALRRRKDQLYSAVVELKSAAEVRRLLQEQESAIQSGADDVSAASELLRFTIVPFHREAPAAVPPQGGRLAALSEAEVLEKMRRAAANAESRT